MTLVEALESAAEDLPAADRVDGSAGTEWRIGGRAFAAVTGGRAEFRLSTAIARAALGTPDTLPSERGSDWVAFAPPELDRFALDRAQAWFGSAARLAAGG